MNYDCQGRSTLRIIVVTLPIIYANIPSMILRFNRIRRIFSIRIHWILFSIIVKVLLEIEACEWQESGEGVEMPKKAIQVSRKINKCFLNATENQQYQRFEVDIKSRLMYIVLKSKWSVRSLWTWRLPPTLHWQSHCSRSQVFPIELIIMCFFNWCSKRPFAPENTSVYTVGAVSSEH